jgi:hypothetical protein
MPGNVPNNVAIDVVAEDGFTKLSYNIKIYFENNQTNTTVNHKQLNNIYGYYENNVLKFKNVPKNASIEIYSYLGILIYNAPLYNNDDGFQLKKRGIYFASININNKVGKVIKLIY